MSISATTRATQTLLTTWRQSGNCLVAVVTSEQKVLVPLVNISAVLTHLRKSLTASRLLTVSQSLTLPSHILTRRLTCSQTTTRTTLSMTPTTHTLTATRASMPTSITTALSVIAGGHSRRLPTALRTMTQRTPTTTRVVSAHV